MNASKNAQKFITLLVVGTFLSKILSERFSASMLGLMLHMHAPIPNIVGMGQNMGNLLLYIISDILYFVILAVIICLIPGFLEKNPTDSVPEPPVKNGRGLNSWYSCFCVYYTMIWIGNLITTLIQSIEEPEVLGQLLADYLFSMNGMVRVLNSSTGYIQENGWGIILFGIIITPILTNVVYRKILMDKLFKYSTGVAVLVPGIVAALATLYSLYLGDPRYGMGQFVLSILGVLGTMIVSMFMAYAYLCTKKVFTLISIQAVTVLIQVLNETYWGVNLWAQMDEFTGYLIAWGLNGIWGIVEIFLLINGICGLFLVRTDLKNIITKDDRKIVFRNKIYVVAIIFILLKGFIVRYTISRRWF